MDNKTLKTLQKKELEILKELDRICKKNDIKYTIAYGTAIGAVRHKGFIPWDDDIDVAMTIDNYKKFQQVVKKDLNQENFYYQNYKTEKHGFVMWDKIRMNNTTSIMKGHENLPIHFGICIDVFPLLKLPKDSKLQNKHRKYIKYAFVLLETELYNYGHKQVGLTGKLFYFFINLLPRNLRKKLISRYLEKVFNYDGDFEKYVDYSEFYKRVLEFPKEMFSNIIEIEFEKEKFPIIKDYDKFLTIVYNDYMKLPPKSERVSHGDLIIDFNNSYENLKSKSNTEDL